jgi:hypothetical protein
MRHSLNGSSAVDRVNRTPICDSPQIDRRVRGLGLPHTEFVNMHAVAATAPAAATWTALPSPLGQTTTITKSMLYDK